MTITSSSTGQYLTYCNPVEEYTTEVDITLKPKNNTSTKQFYKMLNKLLSELDPNWEVKNVITSIEKN